MAFIEMQDLSYTYPKSTKATLQIQSLQIQAGERVFVYGPSGTGKTTFLETLAGILAPQSGSLKIRDVDLAKATTTQRDQFRALHIGYIFQSFNLIPYLNVAENIELPLRMNSARLERLKGQDVTSEVRRLCVALGIEAFLNRPVTELSVGQQQRVAVARALMGAPELILADEPTSALDQDHREKFLDLLFQLACENGTTLIFVSHDRTIEKLFSRSVSMVEINGGSR